MPARKHRPDKYGMQERRPKLETWELELFRLLQIQDRANPLDSVLFVADKNQPLAECLRQKNYLEFVRFAHGGAYYKFTHIARTHDHEDRFRC
jgi:hypothetical protein